MIKLLTVLVLSVLLSQLCEAKKLKHVQVMWRHGDRTPGFLVGNDPTYWELGLGQLTHLGQRMHFLNGQWLRRRYKNFLPSKYNLSDIYVRSTYYMRTMMSAEADMAGLYFDTEPLNENLQWRPVPINVEHWHTDAVFNFPSCPAFNVRFKELFSSKEYLDQLNQYKDTMDYIREVTGTPDMTYDWVAWVYDALFCETQHNKPWPSWITEDSEHWQNILKLNDIFYQILYHRPGMAKFINGLFLHVIRENIQKIIDGKAPYPYNAGEKFVVFSAHDQTVAGFLANLDVWNGINPPYASTAGVELWEDGDQYKVRVFFRNNSDFTGTPHYMDIPGCDGVFCSLDVFDAVTEDKKFTFEEHSEICYSKSGSASMGDAGKSISFPDFHQ